MSKACFSLALLFIDQIFIAHLVYARHMLDFRDTQNNEVLALEKKVIQDGQKNSINNFNIEKRNWRM